MLKMYQDSMSTWIQRERDHILSELFLPLANSSHAVLDEKN